MNDLNYPTIKKSGSRISISFKSTGDVEHKRQVECILDFNLYGDIIGIEIINLKYELGKSCLKYIESLEGSRRPNFGYDKDCDTFYLHLREDTSSDSKAIMGDVILNKEMQIIGFELAVD